MTLKELSYWLILLQTSRSFNKLHTQFANQDITGTKPIFLSLNLIILNYAIDIIQMKTIKFMLEPKQLTTATASSFAL